MLVAVQRPELHLPDISKPKSVVTVTGNNPHENTLWLSPVTL